ncbi:MAG: DegT/DnrJ/EryC1/StrS family aminotransferase [Elusimicrobiales bacterium]|nr:DegT/DnrJ/EryC1/StrS family aminotransferase [Elusimicrobiales bacterium]
MLTPFDPYRLDAALTARFCARLRREAGKRPAALRGAFEEQLAGRAGRRFCLLTASGRDALKIAMKALGTGRNKEVWMTNLTHPSAPEAALWAGARPAFLEISPLNLNLDVSRLARSGKKPGLLLATHMFGTSCDLEAAEKYCAAAGVPLLEDASQAIGGSRAGRPFGSFGELSVFSLSPYKPVSSRGAKAGAVLCSDAGLFARVKAAAREFARPPAGSLPLLALKLETLDATLAGLRSVNAAYRAALARLGALTLPAVGESSHEFPLLARRSGALAAALLAARVPLERTYEPFNAVYRRPGRYPASARYARAALHLPSYPLMTAAEINYAVKKIKEFYAG